ncbi:sigma factor-like helix-turn-helix DNA-binding protein [Corynebacterium sp. A21]|uniref:sigma factor-like helix-turn-helix DNA-binding protein n=1 Tax=Corynebacterium sp. A21 TaxID=3457318 RepID=UPI003FD091EC
MTDLWVSERPRLLAIAYNILGTWADAEDAASEAWLRWRAEPDPLDDARAWLSVVTSRIALDMATAAARSRTDYVGPWLPEIAVFRREAALESGFPAPAAQVELQESVDLALVRLYQNLSPVDRVILVLAEVFALSFKEISRVVGHTPAACRQKASRARKALAESEGAAGAAASAAELKALTSALREGNLAVLTELLSDGCVLWTDSGGLSTAARRPIYGADKVSRFLTGIIVKHGMPEISVESAVGGAVLKAVSPDMVRWVVLELQEGHITGVQIQQHPGKMRMVGP